MEKERTRQILQLAKRTGILRARDLDAQAIPRIYLSRMLRSGQLERIGRGLYVPAGGSIGEHRTLVEASKRVPKGVVCLLSALRFHNLTTQGPREVWLAIGEKAWRPRVTSPPLRTVRFSDRALREGVEVHQIEGVAVRVYSPAKTIVDCFKYRNKIGLDVALEALRECWRARRCTMDDLWRYAKVCRVQNVMRPYLEAMAG